MGNLLGATAGADTRAGRIGAQSHRASRTNGKRTVTYMMIITPLLATGWIGNFRQAAADSPQKLTSVTIGMSYFANVQFAPFYVAEAKGYYRRAGLAVRMRYGISPDFLKLTSTGAIDFVNAAGDEVMVAVSKGYHLRYVMTQYSRFPAALFALQTSGIRRVSELGGHSIGIPLPFGADYVGLLALLHENGIPRSAVSIKTIGFTQPASVAHHQVDAAVGYAMNEPVYLREKGYRLTEFDIYRWANIAGAGVATSDAMIAQHPGIVRAFVRATLAGLRETLRDPNQAYAISARAIKISLDDKVQRIVLQRSLPFSRPEPNHPLGWVDPKIWQKTASLLYQYAQISRPLPAGSSYTNDFVTGSSGR
jgi:NitT/TauT family transport system substrate-binding protein